MKFLILLLLPFALFGHPFKYDLHLTKLEGTKKGVIICCHGMGGSYKVAEVLQQAGVKETLVTFNFPDFEAKEGVSDIQKTTFGTIDELLPLIYVIKTCVIDEKKEEITLYGFSAGGGAIVNALATLNTHSYDLMLAGIGVGPKEKEEILAAIQRGFVLLDAPLKSIREVVASRGLSPALEIIGKRYHDNHMEPIDVLEKLEKLALRVIVHFQTPDEVLSNRDDALYIEHLKKANSLGKTCVTMGVIGGHALPHPALWVCYERELASQARFDKIRGKVVSQNHETPFDAVPTLLLRPWGRG